jgi:lipopolysaccharide export system permease protein
LKILYRYVFTKLWGPFCFGLVGTTLIIALDPMQKAMDYIFKNHVDPWIVLEWFINSLPKDMLFIFPTASLLAGLLVFNGLSRNSELVAIFAGGISFYSLMLPVLVFALLVFGGVFWLQDTIIPSALERRSEIFNTYIRQQKKAKFRKNVVLRISGDRLLCIGRINVASKELFSLVIQESGGRMLSARKANLLDGKQWELHDVWLSSWKGDTASDGGSSDMNQFVKRRVYELDLTARDMKHYDIKKPQEMTYSEILQLIRYHDQRGVLPTEPLWVDFYSKTAFPFAIIIFSLLGASLGIASPRGGGFLGFGVALVLSFAYFILMGFCLPLGKNGLLSPFIAGWAHNFIFMGLTLYMVYRAQKR